MSLDIKDLSVTLGERRVVSEASFTVSPGKLTGLIGANGAGKSSLLRAVMSLIPSTTGDVSLDGQSLRELTPRAQARKIAYLPQGGRPEWALHVRDIVALGRFPFQGPFGRLSTTDREIVEKIITRLDLEAFRDRPVTALSGGERSLVLLARALATEAPYLLADEPTASLDPARQLEVMELLRAEARRGTGLLVVLHDLPLAARFLDEVIVLADGRVIAQGPPGEVLGPKTLEAAYGVTPLSGEVEGERWLLPWRRVQPSP